MSSTERNRERKRGYRTILLGFLGVFIASLCCLPLLGVALGTIGGLGLIIGLATYRLPLTILGVGLFLVGIYQYMRTRKKETCNC